MANAISHPTFTLLNQFHNQLTPEDLEKLMKNCYVILEEKMIGLQTLGKLIHAASHSSEIDPAETEMIGHLVRAMGEQGQEALMVIELAEQSFKKKIEGSQQSG